MKLSSLGLVVLFSGMFAAPCFAQTTEERTKACDSCHGGQGIPMDPAVPIIWGQHQGYIDAQLSDYKNGTRKHEQMAAAVRELGRFDIVGLSEHYSRKPWPRPQSAAADRQSADRAEQWAAKAQCTEAGCHVGFIGERTRPRLAGQSYPYLKATLAAFQARTRRHMELVFDIFDPMTPDDIEALSRYLTGLQSQGSPNP